MIKKYQTSVSKDVENKILSMYAKGMTTGSLRLFSRLPYPHFPVFCILSWFG